MSSKYYPRGTLLRPAVEADRAFVTSSWLQSYASSDMALMATPKDEMHVHTCIGCGHHGCNGCGQHWLRVSGSARHTTKVHAGQMYWSGQRKLVERLLLCSNVFVLESDDGLIDAWSCRHVSAPVVHYAYARASSRGKGAVRTLLADIWRPCEVIYTHKSRGLDSSRLPRGWRFEPYWLMTEAA